jgi:hypothetical protein
MPSTAFALAGTVAHSALQILLGFGEPPAECAMRTLDGRMRTRTARQRDPTCKSEACIEARYSLARP